MRRERGIVSLSPAPRGFHRRWIGALSLIRSVRKRTKACSLIFEYERLIYVFIRNFRLTHYPFGLLLDYGSIVCHDAMILAYLCNGIGVIAESSQDHPLSVNRRVINALRKRSFAQQFRSRLDVGVDIFGPQRFFCPALRQSRQRQA
jgi:hypothetical protein